MESQSKVQAYINKYKISSIFETMMSALVKELPGDPYELMISIIQQNKKTLQSSNFGSEKALSSGWTSTEHSDYDKPWRTNSKKSSSSKRIVPAEAPVKFSRKEWDKTVKLTNKSFDDLAASKQDKRNSPKNNIFAETNTDDRNTYNSFLVSEEQFLAEENVVPSRQMQEAVKTQLPYTHLHPKKRGPKADAARHHKELAAFIQGKTSTASRAESGLSLAKSPAISNGDYDAAFVLCENDEHLKDEGISANPNGQQRKLRKQSNTEPLFSLSICAHCAKLLGNESKRRHSLLSENSSVATRSSISKSNRNTDVASKVSSSTISKKSLTSDHFKTHRTDPFDFPVQNPNLTSNNKDTHSIIPSPVIQQLESARTGFSSYYASEDEDFESVSQVSGSEKRMPVWDGNKELNQRKQSKPDKNGAKLTNSNSPNNKMHVTLKEEVLQKLPRAKNTVEAFLAGSQTWSAERHNGHKSPSQKSPEEKPLSKTYDPLSRSLGKPIGKKSGWNLDYNSDGESLS